MSEAVQQVLDGIDVDVRRATCKLARIVANVLSARVGRELPSVSIVSEEAALRVHYSIPVVRSRADLVDVKCRIIYDVDDLDAAYPQGFFLFFFDFCPRTYFLPEITIDPGCTQIGLKEGDAIHLDDHGAMGAIRLLKCQLQDIEQASAEIEKELQRWYACKRLGTDLVELVVRDGRVHQAPWT